MITMYRVDADRVKPGIVCGEIFISESYKEASDKAIEWVMNRDDLTNVRISTFCEDEPYFSSHHSALS